MLNKHPALKSGCTVGYSKSTHIDVSRSVVREVAHITKIKALMGRTIAVIAPAYQPEQECPSAPILCYQSGQPFLP